MDYLILLEEAFTKLKRLNSNVDYILDNLPPINGIFKQIMVDGNIDILEMYRTFNMGIGFCIVASKEKADEIATFITSCDNKMKCQVIGKIKAKGNGNIFIKRGNELLKI